MPLTGAAAARLYDDHVDAVHALIVRRVGADAATAITGETFEHALKTWERFDGQRGSERLFLFGVATSVLRHHAAVEVEHLTSLRFPVEAGGDVRDPLVARPEHGDESADPDGVDARTMRAVAELPPEDRDILLLSLWESCPQSAIAECLDLPVSAVRSALGRIRRELKIAISKADR